MNTEYSMNDPWGNSRRDFPHADHGMNLLHAIALCGNDTHLTCVRLARECMETRTLDKPIQQVVNAIGEIDGKE